MTRSTEKLIRAALRDGCREHCDALLDELRRLAKMEDEWTALSQDQGKLEGQIDRLQARLAASEDQAERAVAGCERLRAQRDALLEALKAAPSMEHTLPTGSCSCGQCEFVRMRRAAIKAVEGETK